MASFSITREAANEIESRIAVSGCRQPTASLLDSSEAFSPSSDMFDAVSTKAPRSEIHEIAMEEYRALAGKLIFNLDVGIYEAEDCRPHDLIQFDLIQFDGIQFAMPKEMRDYFEDYALDYENNCFVLKHGDKVFLRLSDLERK